jgi:MFS family permease
LIAVLASTLTLALIGLEPGFWAAVALLVVWGFVFAMVMPVRQAYVNGLVPSEHRATVLSFDSLMGSGGGVAIQPVLGRAADVWGYPASYVGCAMFQALALPFAWLARRERASSDPIGEAEQGG